MSDTLLYQKVNFIRGQIHKDMDQVISLVLRMREREREIYQILRQNGYFKEVEK